MPGGGVGVALGRRWVDAGRRTSTVGQDVIAGFTSYSLGNFSSKHRASRAQKWIFELGRLAKHHRRGCQRVSLCRGDHEGRAARPNLETILKLTGMFRYSATESGLSESVSSPSAWRLTYFWDVLLGRRWVEGSSLPDAQYVIAGFLSHSNCDFGLLSFDTTVDRVL